MNILVVVLIALLASCSACSDVAAIPDGGAQVASDGGASD